MTELASDAGNGTGELLPPGAVQLPSEAGAARFIGAAPPAGHGPHRYFIVVQALDVEDIGVEANTTPALLGFHISGHVLCRAVLTATAGTASDHPRSRTQEEGFMRIANLNGPAHLLSRPGAIDIARASGGTQGRGTAP